MPYNEAMSRKLPAVHYALAGRHQGHQAAAGGSRHRRWLVGAGLLLAVIAVVRILSQPVHGHTTAIDIQPKKPTVAKPTAVLPASQQQNSYYSLDLPIGYRAGAGNQTVPGLLYTQLITKPGALGSLVINIAIAKLPVGGLGENSSYRLRVEQSGRYRLTSQVLGGDTIHVFQDSQSGEVTAFWPHHDHLATIGVSSVLENPGAADNAEGQTVLQTMLHGWHWQ